MQKLLVTPVGLVCHTCNSPNRGNPFTSDLGGAQRARVAPMYSSSMPSSSIASPPLVHRRRRRRRHENPERLGRSTASPSGAPCSSFLFVCPHGPTVSPFRVWSSSALCAPAHVMSALRHAMVACCYLAELRFSTTTRTNTLASLVKSKVVLLVPVACALADTALAVTGSPLGGLPSSTRCSVCGSRELAWHDTPAFQE